MMRQAISPRLAIRIFLNNEEPSVAAPHPHAARVPPSPRTRGEGWGEGSSVDVRCAGSRSQRDVVVLFPWVGERFATQHRQCAAKPPPSVAWQDHILDKTAARRDKRIGKFFAVFFGARVN